MPEEARPLSAGAGEGERFCDGACVQLRQLQFLPREGPSQISGIDGLSGTRAFPLCYGQRSPANLTEINDLSFPRNGGHLW